MFTSHIAENSCVPQLEMLSATALRQVIDRETTTVIVPFGSVEHHGGHLPLGTDAILADFVGGEVAARVHAVLAPTVRVGCAEQHMGQSGTMTLRAATLTNVAAEIGQSLATHGFRLIALISTHGGNMRPLRLAAERLNGTVNGAFACAPEGDVGPNPGSHSGEWLTSVMLVLRPDLVQVQAATDALANEVRAAKREQGAIHLERFVSSIVSVIDSHQHAGP